jgi:hypothetical protein
MAESTVKAEPSDGTGARVVLKLHLVGGTGVVAATFTTEKVTAAAVLGLKNKRRVIPQADKVKALAAVEHLATLAEKVKALKKVAGFEHVQASDVTRWTKAGPAKKRGKPRNYDFDRDVLDQLIYTQLADKENAESVGVLANVAYSYDVIRQAALLVQSWDGYQADAKVKALKFSQPWVKDFIDRNKLHRRSVTR